MICLCSKSLKFLRTSKNGLNSDYFSKIAHKIVKSKYFPNIFNDSDSLINSLADDILFVGGNLNLSKIIGGGTPHRRILLFCKIVYIFKVVLNLKMQVVGRLRQTLSTCHNLFYNCLIKKS